MPDTGHELTDKQLAALERRINSEYKKAYKELGEKITAYFDAFKQRDEEQKALVDAGKLTQEKYQQWRLAQIGRGERFEAMRDTVAKRMTNANATAISYVNDSTPGVYTLNRNYAAYTIEQVADNVSFDLIDEQTVKQLLVSAPDLMPYYPKAKALKRGIDLAYGKRQITAQVTQGIIQGESVGNMAKRLQSSITDMNRTSAIRAARTATTGAESAGRMDTYKTAEDMGVKLKKQWLATLDGRTRHSHAMLDGASVATDKKFSNGLMYPGDPSGQPWEVYNCRCTMIADVDGGEAGQRRSADGVGENMTYREWEKKKSSLQQAAGNNIIKAKINSGEYSIKLSKQQQSKHIEGTKQFEQYKDSRLKQGKTPQSILTVDNEAAEKLIRDYATTGVVRLNKSGVPSNVEFVTADSVVGKYFKEDKFIDTKRVAIHYGKRGSHIVPVEEKNNG